MSKMNTTNELPRIWKEVGWIMANLKESRESGNTKGVEKWSKKLAKWRDAHPQEAAAFVRTWQEDAK